MFEFGSQHPVTYRKEIVAPIFDGIIKAKSGVIVGAGSMGKTRLLDFIEREEVQAEYLKEKQSEFILFRVDLNRMSSLEEWCLYEIMLTSIVENCTRNPKASVLKNDLNNLRRPVILEKESLLALRTLELVVRTLVYEKDQNLQICFLLDEFDHAYEQLPVQAFNNLRSLRDQNKNRLSYVLFLRNLPKLIRDQKAVESFAELFGNRLMGLQPYSLEDANRVLEQLQAKEKGWLDETTRKVILSTSGGHPGLLMAIFDEMRRNNATRATYRLDVLLDSRVVKNECQKLFDSLPKIEQDALAQVAKGGLPDPAGREGLDLKGLLVNNQVFSTVFELFLRKSI
jgi:hypothetical protein